MIVIDVVGADNAANKLYEVGRRMLNFAPAFDDIGEAFRRQVAAEFDAAPWQPLAPLTIMLRGGGSKPLNVTLALRNSYASQGGSGNITEIGAQHAKFGSAHTKTNNAGQGKGIAALHQTGTPGGMVPARPVTLVTPALEETIVQEVVDHIFGGW